MHIKVCLCTKSVCDSQSMCVSNRENVFVSVSVCVLERARVCACVSLCVCVCVYLAFGSLSLGVDSGIFHLSLITKISDWLKALANHSTDCGSGGSSLCMVLLLCSRHFPLPVFSLWLSGGTAFSSGGFTHTLHSGPGLLCVWTYGVRSGGLLYL